MKVWKGDFEDNRWTQTFCERVVPSNNMYNRFVLEYLAVHTFFKDLFSTQNHLYPFKNPEQKNPQNILDFIKKLTVKYKIRSDQAAWKEI